MVLEPLYNSISSSFSIEVNWWLGFVLSPEFESRETLDVQIGNFIFSRIDLSNDNVGVIWQSLCSFVEVRSKGLTVSAPWSIKFNQYLFLWLKNSFFECPADQHFNGFFIRFWDFSRLQKLFNFSSLNSAQERG